MSNYIVKLAGSEEVAEGTMAFHLTRPAGFDFRAGQAIDVTLIEPAETDAEGNTRTLSIASPPSEDRLTVVTRMRNSAFKRMLRQAAPGLELKLEGPSGSFILHKNAARPAVFLAGGIGVTPFLSIIREAAHHGGGRNLYLFYSNRTPELSAFLDVLAALPQTVPGFHFVPTMTQAAKSQRPWKGETGYLDREMLLRHLPSLAGPIYYVAGPPAMVTGMRNMLVTAGVDEDDIRSEEFSGY